MAWIFECPKCKQDISDSYEGDDPDTGIVAGWYCETCDKGYGDEDYEGFDDDVRPAPLYTERRRCIKHPEVIPEMGYGLAGGGIGPYLYCPICSAIIAKSEDIGI